ncbi:MAG: SurA N-terminal domain-containing protein [Defluviitaleaceae bacterium]|nr:SurA N-terminal domain-containing protein [Defluviitaleaceae bacterium]
MQTRKQRNLEIERKRKNQKRKWVGIFVMLALIAVGALGWAIWDMQARRWILDFNGERIPTSDFRFFTQGGPPLTEEFRDILLDSLISSLALMERAERYNLSATDEEIAELEDMSRQFRASEPPGSLDFISNRRMAEFYAVNPQVGPVFERAMDHFVPDYTPDEEELSLELQMHIETNREFLETPYIKYIRSSSREEVMEAESAFAEGDMVFDTIDASPLEDFFQEHTDWDTIDWDYIDAIFEVLWALELGQVSHIFEIGEYYFFVQMHERIFDYDAVEEEFREHFINRARSTEFFALIETWVEEADVNINNRTLNRF